MNMNENSYLLNMDALAGMKNIPSESVDLVLTDPPYGICGPSKSKITKKAGKIVSTNEAWGEDFQDAWANVDEYWEWLKPFIAEMERVMKDGSTMLLFLDRKYTGLITYWIEKEFPLNFKNKIYFSKRNCLPSFRKVNYRSRVEECVYFTKGKNFTFNFGEQSEMTQVYEGPIGKKKTKHPTEKYSWMILPLLRNHSAPGSVVLDPFSGSGSTMIHALQEGRKSIGFEKNIEFFEMAKARAAQEQLELNFN
jgi:site-specific DNA-methyltransferase (adenine-specific)